LRAGYQLSTFIICGNPLTRRKNGFLNSNSLVQSSESTIFAFQRSLESIVTSKFLYVVGVGKTVIFEDKADDLSEDLSSSLLLLVIIVIAVCEGNKGGGV
jgi:hypothetical protein